MQVTCVGNIVADIVGKPVDALPGRGKLAMVDRVELHPGGCAVNVSIGLAKLGVETAIVGRVGRDSLGDFLINALDTAGVNTSGVVRDGFAPTSATMVFGHSDGERSFLYSVGANANLTQNDVRIAQARQTEILCVAPFFLLPGLDGEPTAQLLREAQATGLVTAMDTGWDAQGRWLPLLQPCLPHLDYFLPSLAEAQMLAGGETRPDAIADRFLASGVKVVGLKLGEQGCYIAAQNGTRFTIPALKVNATDTLGAGNAWVAGFLTGLTKAWELKECARFANAVAACCVTQVGATTGIRSFRETLVLT